MFLRFFCKQNPGSEHIVFVVTMAPAAPQSWAKISAKDKWVGWPEGNSTSISQNSTGILRAYLPTLAEAAEKLLGYSYLISSIKKEKLHIYLLFVCVSRSKCIYLFVRLERKERQRLGDLPCAGSLLKWLDIPGWARPKPGTRIFIRVCHMGAGRHLGLVLLPSRTH